DVADLQVVQPERLLDALGARDGAGVVVADDHAPGREPARHVEREGALPAPGIVERAGGRVPEPEPSERADDVPAPQSAGNVELAEQPVSEPPPPVRLAPCLLSAVEHAHLASVLEKRSPGPSEGKSRTEGSPSPLGGIPSAPAGRGRAERPAAQSISAGRWHRRAHRRTSPLHRA